jgi:pimeloyl-ACP methyl ester carboxylesterase
VRDAAARGLTLIAYDRPGYGESSPRPDPIVTDCAADLWAISEEVGFSRCAVWGFSGGGPARAFHSPWGFDLAGVGFPVKIWHGEQDHRVPVAHGRLLAAGIQDAEADLREGDGHMTVPAFRIAEVHEWLAQYV